MRVVGFSAYFVDLSRGLQDHIIARTEQKLSIYHLCREERRGISYQGKRGGVKILQDHANSSMKKRRRDRFLYTAFSVHDGPGIGSTVFLKAYPSRCLLGEVMEEVLRGCMFYKNSGGGITISGA